MAIKTNDELLPVLADWKRVLPVHRTGADGIPEGFVFGHDQTFYDPEQDVIYIYPRIGGVLTIDASGFMEGDTVAFPD